LHDQLDPQQKHLLQVEEIQRSDWLICQSASKFVARQVVSLTKNEQQSQNLLHKVDFITHSEKRETSTKTCNETMLPDKLRVFVSRISPPLTGHMYRIEQAPVVRGKPIKITRG